MKIEKFERPCAVELLDSTGTVVRVLHGIAEVHSCDSMYFLLSPLGTRLAVPTDMALTWRKKGAQNVADAQQ